MARVRRIGVVTTSRADYGHLRWPLREMAARPELEPRLYVTGAHLSHEFGTSVHEIERDGQAIAARIESLLSSDTGAGAAKTIGVALMGFADLFGRALRARGVRHELAVDRRAEYRGPRT